MTKAGPFLGRCIPPPPFERANTKDSFLIKHNISVSIHIFVKTALTGWCSIILVNRKYHAIYIHFVDKQKHAVSIQTKLNLKLNKWKPKLCDSFWMQRNSYAFYFSFAMKWGWQILGWSQEGYKAWKAAAYPGKLSEKNKEGSKLLTRIRWGRRVGRPHQWPSKVDSIAISQCVDVLV